MENNVSRKGMISMALVPVTTIIMDNGEVVRVQGMPEEVIKELTHNGKIRNKFIRIGAYYINPSHVSILSLSEEEEDDPKTKMKLSAQFALTKENEEQSVEQNDDEPIVFY